MRQPLSLGFSPCPNDTFIFDALVHGRVDAGGFAFNPRLEDVETLNTLAAAGALQVSKVSYGALPGLLCEYVLLRSGGALGRGCGPLVVAREPRELRGARIAIPGERTTANLLLRLWNPELPPGIPMVYSEIMPAVARGEMDAGLIIHESRFTYREHGLTRLVDLGEWWEGDTGLPIPLGGIVAQRALGTETIARVESAIRRSVEYAFEHPGASQAYVTASSQEMDSSVMRAHIELYVNQYSLELGDEGERAVLALLRRADSQKLSTSTPDILFNRVPERLGKARALERHGD
jgi:1,4-dihydroxy-6-naphthoate synthase